MAPPKRFSAAEKGKARPVEPDCPPTKRGRGCPRKHHVTPAKTTRGLGGDRLIGGGRCVAAVRPPCPRFHSAEVLPEFVVWSEDPVGTWIQLPRFFDGELPAGATSGLWFQADGCCSKVSWVAVETSATGNSPGPRLADVRPRARPGQAVHPPLQVRWWIDPLCEGVWGRWLPRRVLPRNERW